MLLPLQGLKRQTMGPPFMMATCASDLGHHCTTILALKLTCPSGGGSQTLCTTLARSTACIALRKSSIPQPERRDKHNAIDPEIAAPATVKSFEVTVLNLWISHGNRKLNFSGS